MSPIVPSPALSSAVAVTHATPAEAADRKTSIHANVSTARPADRDSSPPNGFVDAAEMDMAPTSHQPADATHATASARWFRRHEPNTPSTYAAMTAEVKSQARTPHAMIKLHMDARPRK